MTIHHFAPVNTADDVVAEAAGEVEVLELVNEQTRTERGVMPAYRVRNLHNHREAIAFGDELST